MATRVPEGAGPDCSRCCRQGWPPRCAVPRVRRCWPCWECRSFSGSGPPLSPPCFPPFCWSSAWSRFAAGVFAPPVCLGTPEEGFPVLAARRRNRAAPRPPPETMPEGEEYDYACCRGHVVRPPADSVLRTAAAAPPSVRETQGWWTERLI